MTYEECGAILDEIADSLPVELYRELNGGIVLEDGFRYHWYAQNNDPRYTGDPVPEAECLADVVKRVEPYFKSDIEPQLKAGKTVLIAAHGNSLRAIVKMLDNLSEEEIAKVNIPTAMPLLYELDENFKPIKPRGEYLDPEAAAAGAAAVAAQGQK